MVESLTVSFDRNRFAMTTHWLSFDIAPHFANDKILWLVVLEGLGFAIKHQPFCVWFFLFQTKARHLLKQDASRVLWGVGKSYTWESKIPPVGKPFPTRGKNDFLVWEFLDRLQFGTSYKASADSRNLNELRIRDKWSWDEIKNEKW